MFMACVPASLADLSESISDSASLPGIIGTLSQVLTASGPNGTGHHSSEENRCVRDNTALLVNNIAAIGGDEAVSVLCRCKPLIVILVELLALHNDGPVVLKRFVGCFNHLSRSDKVCQIACDEVVANILSCNVNVLHLILISAFNSAVCSNAAPRTCPRSSTEGEVKCKDGRWRRGVAGL